MLGRRLGRCPSPNVKWIWKAATWEVAHRLSRANLCLDQGHTAALRLDSEASLLTWDNLQRAGNDDKCAAMHTITPRLITIPGLELPVVHLQSSYVRLGTVWNWWIKHAWICQGALLPLLYASVHRRQHSSGEWQSQWGDMTPDVLRRCNLPAPAKPSAIELLDFGPVRGRMQTPPRWYKIGSGTGQMFHEAVALHAADCFRMQRRGAREGSIDSYVTAERLYQLENDRCSRRSGRCRSPPHHLLVRGRSDSTRVSRALVKLLDLRDDAQRFADNGIPTAIGRVSVVFVSPPGAAARLSGDADRHDLESWVIQAIGGTNGSGSTKEIRAAIIETGNPDELRGTDRDPKHVIRRALAAKGVVTQFLSITTSKTTKTVMMVNATSRLWTIERNGRPGTCFARQACFRTRFRRLMRSRQTPG